MSLQNTFATFEQYLLYLRKSRQDDPNETVEEVLAKHEVQLQEYARRELGGNIPEENIYREVVSGESIADREEIKKVLARIEDPTIKGVLVIEPSRLSRGDLVDCGRLINDLRYTKTLVLTPYMTYDLENKMERKFFQDELLRGRDYLEYTKEILLRGRVAAVKRGCYIGQYAPYGYNKIKIGKDHTLEINEDEAAVVRLIFEMYTKEMLTPGRIAQRLNKMSVKAPRGDKWVKDTIRSIVRNQHYIGKVTFNKIRNTTLIENGEKVVKRLTQPENEMIIVEGKHPAIIDNDTWDAAKKLVARNPREKHTYALKNPLASLLYCGKCGRVMYQHPYKQAEDRYECRTLPRCFKSVKMSEMYDAVITALEQAELPALQLKYKNDDGNALKIQQKLLEKLEKQMVEYVEQEETQFELLETRQYTQDLFDRRNAILREKMAKCQLEIYQTKKSMPKSIDYAEKIVALEEAIKTFKDEDATPEAKNKALRGIVERIDFYGMESDHLNRKRNVFNKNEFTIKVSLRV